MCHLSDKLKGFKVLRCCDGLKYFNIDAKIVFLYTQLTQKA